MYDTSMNGLFSHKVFSVMCFHTEEFCITFTVKVYLHVHFTIVNDIVSKQLVVEKLYYIANVNIRYSFMY